MIYRSKMDINPIASCYICGKGVTKPHHEWCDECIAKYRKTKSIPKRKKKKKRKIIYPKLHPRHRDIGIRYSKELKNRATKAEMILFNALIDAEIQFEFQKPVASRRRLYILDFHIQMIGKNLCVECDGDYHTTKKQKKKDNIRSNYLRSIGYIVLRFSNEEIINNVASVVENIKILINSNENRYA